MSGIDFDLGVGSGDGPPETFVVLPGCQSNGLQIGKELVDNSTKDNANVKSLLEGGGRFDFKSPFNGIVKAGNALLQQMSKDCTAGTTKNYQVTVPNFATFTGPFQISSFELTGNDGENVTFTATLESAGVVAQADL